jgi:competence protein ComEA
MYSGGLVPYVNALQIGTCKSKCFCIQIPERMEIMKVAADKLRKWLSGKTNSGQHRYSGSQPARKAGSAERLLSARLLRTKLPGLLCVSGAVILLLLAFSGENSGAGGEWVPLNDALQAKLDGVEDAALWARSENKPESKKAATSRDENSSQTAAANVDGGPNGNDSGGDIAASGSSGSGSSIAGIEGGATGKDSGGVGAAGEPNGSGSSIAGMEGGATGKVSGNNGAADEPNGPVNSGGAAGAADNNGKLDINRATAAELETLKGIGPSKAAAIVRDRELNGFFLSVDDLLRVKGIGDRLLAGLKESVVANR